MRGNHGDLSHITKLRPSHPPADRLCGTLLSVRSDTSVMRQAGAAVTIHYNRTTLRTTNIEWGYEWVRVGWREVKAGWNSGRRGGYLVIVCGEWMQCVGGLVMVCGCFGSGCFTGGW